MIRLHLLMKQVSSFVHDLQAKTASGAPSSELLADMDMFGSVLDSWTIKLDSQKRRLPATEQTSNNRIKNVSV